MIRAPVLLLPRLRRAGIRGTAPPTAAVTALHGGSTPSAWQNSNSCARMVRKHRQRGGRRRAANFGREANSKLRPPLDEMQEAKKPGCGISCHRRSRPASRIFLVTCHKKEAKMRDAGMQNRGIKRPSVTSHRQTVTNNTHMPAVRPPPVSPPATAAPLMHTTTASGSGTPARTTS